MNFQKSLAWCDRVAFFGFCGFIYFLPISIALIETFGGIALFAFFVKRGILFSQRVKNKSRDPLAIASSLFRFFNPLPSFLNIPVGIFIFISFLSVVTSQYKDLSLQGFFFKVLEWTFLCFIFFEVVHSPKRLKIFLGTWAVSSLIAMGNGIYQKWTGYDFIYHNFLWSGRVSSSFRHSNDFGAYLVVVSLVALSLAVFYWTTPRPRHQDSVYWKILVWFIMVLSLISLWLTLSRGAWLGFMIGLAFLIFQKRKFDVITVSILIVSVLIVIPNLMNLRRATFVETYKSGSGRTVYWKEAWNMIRDYPVLGVGLNSYSRAAPRYKDRWGGWGGYPHNCYLQMAVETGIVGLMSFLGVVAVLFWRTIRNLRRIQDGFLFSVLLGLSAGLLGFLVHSSFDTNFYSVQLGNMMWVAMGAILAVQKMSLSEKDFN